MFNIQPGLGLGFDAGKEIALGLGMPFIIVTPPPSYHITMPSIGGGGMVRRRIQGASLQRLLREDNELLEVLIALDRIGEL